MNEAADIAMSKADGLQWIARLLQAQGALIENYASAKGLSQDETIIRLLKEIKLASFHMTDEADKYLKLAAYEFHKTS